MPTKLRVLVAAVPLMALPFLAPTAAADQVFHTLHADLTAVNGAPLKSGFVNDVHTNGVVNSAQEIYHLSGAAASTTYQVTIFLYPFDPTCSTAPIMFPTTTVTTNGAGNGNAQFTFAAGPPTPLTGGLHGILWQFTGPDGLAYETGCNPLTLD
jgi:hypothetical protein